MRIPLIALLCILTTPNLHADDLPYRVGAILPLSGPLASLGNYVRNGIQLAYDTLPPEQRKGIALSFENDQFEPARTVTAYRKLVGSGGLDAAFVLGSPPGNALSPVVEREKRVLIAIGASDPSIAVGKEYSFIHWVIPPVLGELLAAEIKRCDFKRIAFVTSEVTGALADTEAAVAALKASGLGDRVVYRKDFAMSDTDFRTAISQMRQKDIDVAVLVLMPGNLSTFAKQVRSVGLKAPIIGMETFEDEAEIKAAQGALDGAWYVNASDPTGEFIELYKARFKEHPGWGAGNAYDTMKMVAQIVSKVGNNSAKVREGLRQIKNYQGATGIFSASGDNRFTLPAMVKRVTSNGFESIKGHACQ